MIFKEVWCTVLSAGFSILCTRKLQYIECTIYVHVPDFYFRSIAVYITVYIPYFILPTNGPDISGGVFLHHKIAVYLP